MATNFLMLTYLFGTVACPGCSRANDLCLHTGQGPTSLSKHIRYTCHHCQTVQTCDTAANRYQLVNRVDKTCLVAEPCDPRG